jgi:hypothetical protein
MTCSAPEVLAAWVDGEVTLEVDQRLRQHVIECARCASEVQRLRASTDALGRLELAAPAPGFTREFETKLSGSRTASPVPRRVLLGAAGAAAICALAFGLMRFDATDPGTFSPRGNAARRGSRVGFEVYAHEPGRERVRLREGQQLRADTGYSFVVFNRSKEPRRVMLFALDARGDVHWFYPAFLDPGADPQSILVGAQPQVQSLPDGITPDNPAVGPLRFVGVFSKAPLLVSEVERSIQRGGLEALARAHADADVQSLRAELKGTP